MGGMIVLTVVVLGIALIGRSIRKGNERDKRQEDILEELKKK